MSDTEITSAILRKMRDNMDDMRNEVRAFRGEFRMFQDEVRGDFSLVHTVLRDLAGRMATLTRFVQKHEGEMVDLRKRVVKLENKTD
jgi:hypothetical protein